MTLTTGEDAELMEAARGILQQIEVYKESNENKADEA